MKKTFFSLLILLITTTIYCQTKVENSKFNLDFEIFEKGVPLGWNKFGDQKSYIFSLDSTSTKNEKHSAAIEFKGEKQSYGIWGYIISDKLEGKKITLSGYIKTENVTDGYAGLWMRIDPNIAFENMAKNGIKGTTDWTKYEITLKMNPEKTTKLNFGGLLTGKGKMWLDDLKITIDGKSISDLKEINRKLLPAEMDKEFDNGSSISSFSIDKNQIDNIKTLGLIWGFLKYYHPNIAKGDYNWDYELFRILPGVLKSEDRNSRDKIIENWIVNLGEFSKGENLKTDPSMVKAEPDLDWITTSDFSAELTSLLLNVKNAKRSNNNYYIELIPGLGNPDFKNENPYSSMGFPDAGFRLLALYKYWNMVQYYFPYKNLLDEDWKNVLVEYIPKIINVKNEIEYTLTLLELIGRIHDTHANIFFNTSVHLK